ASSTTPIRPMRAGWTASGAPTSGSTGRRRDETKRASGGDAMTSTTSRLSQPITLFSKREASDAELSPDRVAAGLGGRARAAADEGESGVPGPRRAGRRAPADA